jgi:PhzF family phenazine biosynthesis protein
MQLIAAENNLSETAFIRLENDKYLIRWLSPSCEIDLCGHATLASAFIYFNYINTEAAEFEVHSLKNGALKVSQNTDYLFLDFPKDNIQEDDEYRSSIIDVLGGIKPKEIFKGRDDLLVILDNESDIEELQPDFALLKKIPFRGIIVSAPSSEFDFVSRCFFPSTGVDEDPVTGSAHTTLTPYWSKRLDKKKLSAKQVSQRGGLLSCEDADDRVLIGGKAVLYMIGCINLT